MRVSRDATAFSMIDAAKDFYSANPADFAWPTRTGLRSGNNGSRTAH